MKDNPRSRTAKILIYGSSTHNSSLFKIIGLKNLRRKLKRSVRQSSRRNRMKKKIMMKRMRKKKKRLRREYSVY